MQPPACIDKNLTDQILRLFEEVDAATAETARQTGLQCPEGCGHCCLNPNVHASETELGPLALHLWASGRAEEVLAKLDALPPGHGCVLYQPSEPSRQSGRCGAYPFRPLVCRLFGFGARLDKTGFPELSACAIHKTQAPESVQAAEKWIAEGGKVAVFGAVYGRLLSLDPGAASDLQPINQALRHTLEKTGYLLEKYGVNKTGLKPPASSNPPDPAAQDHTALPQ